METLLSDLSILFEQFLPKNISQNSIFIGFLGAALVGSAGFYGQMALRAAYSFLRRTMFDQLTIHSDTDALYYLDRYIQDNNNIHKRRNVMVTYSNKGRDEGCVPYEVTEGDSNTDKTNNIHYSLGAGIHFLIIKGRLCYYERSVTQEKMTGKKIEEVTLRIFGTNGKEVIGEAIQEMVDKDQSDDTISIYASESYDYNHMGDYPRRDISSIILSDDTPQDLVKDIDIFIDRKEWYQERGITYKRGYLLYGPPGTGKSSLAKAITCKYSSSLFCVNLASVPGDDALAHTIHNAKRRTRGKELTFILLEDVDCISVTNHRDADKKENLDERVTLNGVLNVLDGVASLENTVIIMTTNRKEILDPALIRPGRADKHFLIDVLDKAAIIEYVSKFFREEVSPRGVPKGLSICGSELQNICMESATTKEVFKALKAVPSN